MLEFITKCCYGFEVNPQTVIDNLLSFEDEKEIKQDLWAVDEVSCVIGLWIKGGMPRYTDKPIGHGRRQGLDLIKGMLNGK